MRNRVVVNGFNEEEIEVLIGLELQLEKNNIELTVIPSKGLEAKFKTAFRDKWTENKSVDFPEETIFINHKLSASSLLPAEIKVLGKELEFLDKIKQDWLIAVLSSRLFQMLQMELDDVTEKTKGLTKYDKELWAQLKELWDKVKMHREEKNLGREHAQNLRDAMNVQFEKLKALREESNSKFQGVSDQSFELLDEQLADYKKRLGGEYKFNVLFDELKIFQEKVKKTQLTQEHKKIIHDKTQEVFKKVIADKSSYNSERTGKRILGLNDAIERIKKSIAYDEKGLEFNERDFQRAGNKFQEQLLTMKKAELTEKVTSKKAKLADMMKTLKQLEK